MNSVGNGFKKQNQSTVLWQHDCRSVADVGVRHEADARRAGPSARRGAPAAALAVRDERLRPLRVQPRDTGERSVGVPRRPGDQVAPRFRHLQEPSRPTATATKRPLLIVFLSRSSYLYEKYFAVCPVGLSMKHASQLNIFVSLHSG